MIAEMAGALSSVKTAYDLVKSMNAAVTEVRLMEVKVELLQALGEAHGALLGSKEAQAADAERIRTLEAEIGELKEWSGKTEQYHLADAGQGVLAYKANPAGPIEHYTAWYCPTCFGNRKLSLLQPVTVFPGASRVLACHTCGLELFISGHRQANLTGRR